VRDLIQGPVLILSKDRAHNYAVLGTDIVTLFLVHFLIG